VEIAQRFENMMIETMRFKMIESLKEYRKTVRSTWVKNGIGQCVISISQVMWATLTEMAIENNTLPELKDK